MIDSYNPTLEIGIYLIFNHGYLSFECMGWNWSRSQLALSVRRGESWPGCQLKGQDAELNIHLCTITDTRDFIYESHPVESAFLPVVLPRFFGIKHIWFKNSTVPHTLSLFSRPHMQHIFQVYNPIIGQKSTVCTTQHLFFFWFQSCVKPSSAEDKIYFNIFVSILSNLK